jgi:hypothetical protein
MLMINKVWPEKSYFNQSRYALHSAVWGEQDMWGWEQGHYIPHAKNIDLTHRCWTAERWASKTKLLVLSVFRCLRHWTICLPVSIRSQGKTWFRVVRQGSPPYADSELTTCGRSELNNTAARSRQLLLPFGIQLPWSLAVLIWCDRDPLQRISIIHGLPPRYSIA